MKKPVKSSNIDALDYDPEKHLLTVFYKDGSAYGYHGVAPHEYEALERAKSIGGHVATKIKGKFKFTKLVGR